MIEPARGMIFPDAWGAEHPSYWYDGPEDSDPVEDLNEEERSDTRLARGGLPTTSADFAPVLADHDEDRPF